MGKLNVIGLGYIGLPTALMFAASGIEVVGTDLKKTVIDELNCGKVTFKEDGLKELFTKAQKVGIEFSTEYISTDLYIVAVPTPYLEGTKKIDVSFVISAVHKILDVCERGTTLIIESTISPGTIDKHIRPIIHKRGFKEGVDIHLVHAPERIIPGRMFYELRNNSRTIGADSKEVGEKVVSLYKNFCSGDIVLTTIKIAEMSKVVENTFRDINIAFANELVKICKSEDIDVYELIDIANKHPRVNILKPGPGVGGHCIPVDPWFLVGDYPQLVNVILSARQVNDSMPDYIMDRIREVMKEEGINDISKVGLYGLTYKEDIDDIRMSPTIQLLDKLNRYFVKDIKVYDPLIEKKIYEHQHMDFNEFIKAVELVVVMVGHSHIISNMQALKGKVVLDTRNIISLDKVYKL